MKTLTSKGNREWGTENRETYILKNRGFKVDVFFLAL
jgi:hypothetical protein